jgi:hypothetical protein
VNSEQMIAAAKARIVEQGACGVCGSPWAAHRRVDAQMGRVIAGDLLMAVAIDYQTTPEWMVAGWAALMELLSERVGADGGGTPPSASSALRAGEPA